MAACELDIFVFGKGGFPMRFLIFALLLAPSLAQAGVLGCGARLNDGKEIMFSMYPSVQPTELVSVSFGHLKAMKTQKILISKSKTGFGLWKKESFTGQGFNLQNKGGGEFVLTAKVPSIELNVSSLRIDCIEY